MSKGRGDYPGSNDSNLGPVGRAAQAVCLATMPNSHQEWATTFCAEVGRKADETVNHDISSTNNYSSYDNGRVSSIGLGVIMSGLTNEQEITNFYSHYGDNSHHSTEY